MKEVSIVLCGEAGQGIATVEQLVTGMLKLSGYHVYSTSEFMSRIRGGTNSTLIRISDEKSKSAFIDRIDILFPLSSKALKHLEHRISPETIIIGEEGNIAEEYCPNRANIIKVDFTKIANEIGGKIYTNIVSVGIFLALFGVEENISKSYLTKRFSSKGDTILQNNIKACQRGSEIGNQMLEDGKLKIDLQKDDSVKNYLTLNGSQAIAMGSIAAGLNFISSYPMSPSTGVLVFLSQKAEDFGIIIDQAEDEIAAVNKGIGAWYAGARAMITTSGGGFALMTEGLSLSGILETPMVFHIAQRPGPGTGLPTRTGQEDLQFVLNGGHGEFARAIFAPGNAEEAFFLTQHAFNLADKYQVPVFILSDQFLVDSHYSLPDLDLTNIKNTKYIEKTDENYKRYLLTENGISPRGIPGYGSGLVNVDSDEHDEEGHITEDVHDLRPKMVDKRLYKKLKLLKEDFVKPELIGPTDYSILLIGWGSTYSAVKEALELSTRKDVAFLHFKQVYPLSEDTIDYLKKAKKVVVVENNATAQFGKVITLEYNIKPDQFLKYNGMPFSVEEVKEFIEKI
ncbi:2-oxoacid:ferredoxin oxidoreductase subunit alpha [Candidatus Heimdallarchaeota archaeon B3_Heim]|nr:MAG: 2-oxoacid:ferredoxin oxidoreductase subunit alpha [Candidatus Heimdallarchaeota archaeon B3_Heim]